MEEALFEDKIFSIVPKTTHKERKEILSIIAGPLEHLLGLRQCTAMYEQVKSQCDSHLFHARGSAPIGCAASRQNGGFGEHP